MEITKGIPQKIRSSFYMLKVYSFHVHTQKNQCQLTVVIVIFITTLTPKNHLEFVWMLITG